MVEINLLSEYCIFKQYFEKRMSDLLQNLIHDARVWQGHQHHKARHHNEPTGFAALDASPGPSGWPRGALSECLLNDHGIGELQLVLPLIRRLSQAGKTVFWVNPPHTPYAPALAREEIALDQVVIIHTNNADDLLWTLENCLRSPVTGLVMAWPDKLSSRGIRRLQLAAEAGSNLCILFRSAHHAQQSSPAALRLTLTPAAPHKLEVSTLKRRGSWPEPPGILDMPGRTGISTHRDSTIPAHVIQGPWPGPTTDPQQTRE